MQLHVSNFIFLANLDLGVGMFKINEECILVLMFCEGNIIFVSQVLSILG